MRPETHAESRAGVAVSFPRAGMPRILEAQKNPIPRLPKNPTARRGAGEKRKEPREELTAPSAAPGDVSELAAGRQSRGIGNKTYRAREAVRRRPHFFLPRSAPPGARPPGYTSSASRSFSSRVGSKTEPTVQLSDSNEAGARAEPPLV